MNQGIFQKENSKTSIDENIRTIFNLWRTECKTWCISNVVGVFVLN